MCLRKYIKNIGLVLVILGHYYFCSYVLNEVSVLKDIDPLVIKVYEDKSDEKNNQEKVLNKTEDVKITKSISNDYLGIVKIPKINLQKKLYDIQSDLNDVDKNIEIIKGSSMPNIENSNLILAAHNGNTSLGYFRNLNQLTIGDEVIINYKGEKYVYEVSKIYDVLKTGRVAIKRDKGKKAITLITCLGSDRQLVVIGYLK